MFVRRLWDTSALTSAEMLSLLESREYVRRLSFDMNGRSLNDTRANEVVAAISQGRAYFAAAAVSDHVVQPLLQYYGVLAFSRALILLRTGMGESGLKPSHGLKIQDWSPAFAFAKGARGILDTEIEVEGGTFTQLCEAINNTEAIMVNDSPEWPLVLASPSRPFQIGERFRFDDLLARMPQLGDVYLAALGGPLNHWSAEALAEGSDLKLQVLDRDDTTVGEIRLRELTAAESSTRVVESLDRYSEVPDRGMLVATFRTNGPEEWGTHLAHVRQPMTHTTHLVEPFSNGASLPSIVSVFAAAYWLGMLVRYYPSHWLDYVSKRSGDAEFPLMRAVSSLVHSYPDLFLNSLIASDLRASTPIAVEESEPPDENETQVVRDRRIYKARLLRKQSERQAGCSHRRVTETPMIGARLFSCEACGKRGPSVRAIRRDPEPPREGNTSGA